MSVRIVLVGPESEVVATAKELSDKFNFEFQPELQRFMLNKKVVRAFGMSKEG